MKTLDTSFLETAYKQCKEETLFGKWVTFTNIEPLYKILPKNCSSEIIGFSENNIPIYKIELGTGEKRILVWSQMHGNEATGTKVIFDFINFIKQNATKEIVKSILENCKIIIIPMLNPDGALAYTRSNAGNIDLNRDAVDLKAVESKLLRKVLDEFNPKFCFNLHDQRTIFGVEGTQNPASISFLAPSEEETRKITKGRKATMNVIIAMNVLLQQIIPNCIGRYTDEFYPTATGDNFQKLGHNTILIEAGHYKDDYTREKVRKFNFYALLQGLHYIAVNNNFSEYASYFDIPNNVKNFFDVIHRYKSKDIAYQFKEEIVENLLIFKLEKEKEGNLEDYLAHHEIIFG